MTTKHKPATPLPWQMSTVKTQVGRCHRVGDTSAKKGYACLYDDYSYTDEQTIPSKDAAYIAHAANAYPRLVEALQHTLALSNPRSDGQRYQYDKAYNLLRELGED